MPEDERFKTEARRSREEIAQALADAADQLAEGTVLLQGDDATREVTVPDTPRFEVELERLTDSETGDQRYELEYEIRWTETE